MATIETPTEQIARLTGYDEGVVGLALHVSVGTLPHVEAAYRAGYVKGRAARATKFGARDRRLGRPINCPAEFRLPEARNAYADAYNHGG